MAPARCQLNVTDNTWRGSRGDVPIWTTDNISSQPAKILHFLRKQKCIADNERSAKQGADMLAYILLLETKLLPVVLPHSRLSDNSLPWQSHGFGWLHEFLFSWVWSFLEECLREHWIRFSWPKESLPSTTSEKWKHRYTEMPGSAENFCQTHSEQLHFALEIHLLPWLPMCLVFLHLFINYTFLKFNYMNIWNSSLTCVFCDDVNSYIRLSLKNGWQSSPKPSTSSSVLEEFIGRTWLPVDLWAGPQQS